MDEILVEQTGGILRVTLNRPEVLNALTENMIDGMLEILLQASRNRAIGVVVFGGSGRAFSSGFDAHIMAEITSDRLLELFFSRNIRLSSLLHSMPQPVIAEVHGYCVGGGYELALFCDLIVADETAVFYCSGVNSGSSPVWGGTQMLPLNVGEKRARQIVYAAAKLSADEALEMGLINAVVPLEQRRETVDEWCRRLLDMSPAALRLSKRSINAALTGIYPGLITSCDFAASSAGAEARHGFGSFLDKRAPDYREFRPAPAQS